jgi:hypothetical protein
MSSRFSRRSTRVQHKPHICISDKPIQTPPPPPGPQAEVQLVWSLMDILFAQSDKNATITLDETSTGNYSATTTDDQGRTCNVTLQIPTGSASQCNVSIASFDGTQPQLQATGGSYPGAPPWNDGPNPFNVDAALTGGGDETTMIT